ncbi:evolutionarily conserved signaling intermediate in Toll pathway, mitochondrial [Homalodisca vitripennis]|uniref:evolutionarily conserved signaling intermediate in Toll pathway, mitochondrial n=1 Tax=Homalodisca vitripennis TaxID=197043 RepID=UPI001EEC9B6E|nr:evolutionarily conserved signaling intermediate in Toll pathway, mitochondrial [Homalodisca vitripennis]
MLSDISGSEGEEGTHVGLQNAKKRKKTGKMSDVMKKLRATTHEHNVGGVFSNRMTHYIVTCGFLLIQVNFFFIGFVVLHNSNDLVVICCNFRNITLNKPLFYIGRSRMREVLETKEVKDSIDETWIVSGQSPLQKDLIERHDVTEPLFVEGSFRVWLRGTSVNYFILRADPDLTPKPEQDNDDISRLSLPLFEPPTAQQIARATVVHEQEDSVILATCATGSSSRDSLLSWIRLLQRDNPRLGEIPVLFTLKSPIGTTEPLKEIEGDDPVPVVINKIPIDKP